MFHRFSCALLHLERYTIWRERFRSSYQETPGESRAEATEEQKLQCIATSGDVGEEQSTDATAEFLKRKSGAVTG
jgi:hypothetical protein